MDKESDFKLTNQCITCGVDVKDEDQALQCDLCEGWEHINCIRMCDRPSQACYNALTQTPCKSLLFTCSRCKRKGTLARCLMHAQLTFDSAQVQKGLYEQLLADKTKEAERLSYEREALQLERKCLEDRLEDVRSQLEEARHELCVLRIGSTTERTAATSSEVEMKRVHTPPLVSTPYSSGPWSRPALSSVGRRKLPQIPVLTAVQQSTVVPSSEESTRVSAVTPSVSEGMNVSLQPVLSVSSTAGTVQRSDVTTLLIDAANHLTTESLPTAVSSVPMFTTPVLSRTVAHTVGSTERASFAATYPVLGSITTTVPAPPPAHPGVHMPLPVSVGTLVPASRNLSTTPTTGRTTKFKQPPAFKELRERVNKFSGESKEDFEVWLADYC